MKYGFVIDNRKCIGCHACTTACKSEHNVPVGVNRTWVKQVEKGTFPDTRRLFSVMRCNHCADAPCVDICPTEALYTRKDGIVDFDKDRCIGCKSCMQACPYDALYIDPETNTAAKCNYCAHRIDIGLEPACVNVCPEHAIISGDMDDPSSEIAQLLSQQAVNVRKPEKGTSPNLFYIDGDEASLNPSATERTGAYLWSQQTTGVGHFAKEAEKLAFSNGDVITHLLETEKQYATSGDIAKHGPQKSIELIMGKTTKRVYDTPDKGILWGWEVSGYVFTKAISTGVFIVPFLALFFNWSSLETSTYYWSYGLGMFFLILTGILLIMDLDQPKRFLYVLLRPHWGSWLVKGGYAITAFGGLLSALLLSKYLELNLIHEILFFITMLVAAVVAIYTAFLFAQAKGRDFWQSPSLAIHMLVHSVMAGAATFGVLTLFAQSDIDWTNFLQYLLMTLIGVNVATLLFELTTTHPTVDAEQVSNMIKSGRYSRLFYFGTILIGNLIPMLLLLLGNTSLMLPISGVLVLIGIFLTEKIWVEAPQRIPLT